MDHVKQTEPVHVGSASTECAGVQYPLEAQVIASISPNDLSTCPDNGCQVGISVLYTLFDAPDLINTFLDSVIPYIPYNGAVCSPHSYLLRLIPEICRHCVASAACRLSRMLPNSRDNQGLQHGLLM